MKHRIAGFTLIELLVVIAIIALLISILIPVLASARYSGKNTVCVNNLRQLSVGLNLYYETYHQFYKYPPFFNNPNFPHVAFVQNDVFYLSPFLDSTMQDVSATEIDSTREYGAIWRCPLDFNPNNARIPYSETDGGSYKYGLGVLRHLYPNLNIMNLWDSTPEWEKRQQKNYTFTDCWWFHKGKTKNYGFLDGIVLNKQIGDLENEGTPPN